MIELCESDLADLHPDTPVPTLQVRMLVRIDGHVLGEVVLPDDAAWYHHPTTSEPTLRDVLEALFATELAAHRLAVGDEPSAALVDANDITICVCTHHRADHLTGCLTAMSRLDPAPGQVLVVDNGPLDDSTRRVAQAHQVDYVVAPALGLNRARNVAARSATRPIVAYVDDDARVDTRFAAAVAAGFLDDQVGAVSGLVLPAELATHAQIEFERLGGMRKGYRRRLFSPGSVGLQAFQLGVGTNMAFRVGALLDIGGFDEQIGVGTPSRGGGDLDALWRVLHGGDDVVYEPNAIVRHFHRTTIDELVLQHRDYGTAYAAVLTNRSHDYGRRAAVNERLRWHLRRHGRDALRALRSRDRLAVRLLRSEAAGALQWHRRPR